MGRIVQLALAHRLMTIALAAIVAAFGIRAALALPIDAVPDSTNVQV